MREQLYSYWEGFQPPLIEYCLKTIQEKSDIPVVVLTPENIDQYIGTSLHSNYKSITNIAQKVDCIRIAVLHNHGGMWCDADTIVLRPLQPLFDKVSDFKGIRWVFNNRLLNGYFLSKAKGKFISKCLEDINEQLSCRQSNYWADPDGVYFGESLFTRVQSKDKYRIDLIPQHVLLPVSFPCAPKIWGEDYEINRWLTKDTLSVALNYSHFMPFMKNMDIKALSETKTLIGSILRYSLMGKDAPISTLTREETLKLVKDIIPQRMGMPVKGRRQVDQEAKKRVLMQLQSNNDVRIKEKTRR